MNDKIKELKDLLFELDSKHSVSVPDTQQNINDVAQKIVKLFTIPVVRRSAYEKGLHSKIREINNDTQLLLERWDELKDLEFSSEHRGLFNAMKEFIEVHCA